MYMYIGALL